MSSETKAYDVFGVGNALLDIMTFVEPAFLEKHELPAGIMTLADSARQGDILYSLQDHKMELRSGGSAANTVYNMARLGGTAVYIGKIAGDANGSFYKEDMEKAGIVFDITPLPEDTANTGSCVVLTTPDAQRTMCTHLGASIQLQKSDIDVEKMKQSQFAYIEGYLWDAEGPRQACEFAMEEAKKHGVRVAFTYSDPFLVNRYGDDFKRIVKEYCDVVFCNAEEARHVTGWNDLDACVKELNGLANHVFITNSEKGAFVAENGEVSEVGGFPVKAVDTTGAGDAFASGVLFGLSHGYSSPKAARLGNYLGSQIVQVHGPRLLQDYSKHVKEIIGEPDAG